MNNPMNLEQSILNRPIFQSNELIEACKNMNTWCYRLFLLGAQAIKPHITEEFEHDEDFPVTVIPYKTLMELLGHPSGITNIKANLEKAYNGNIVIYTETGGLKLRHIYQIMDYEPSTGLKIQFSKSMKPYLIDLVDKKYTSYLMKYTFVLTSSYGWKLLELMFRYKGFIDKKGMKEIFRIFSVEELREKLNIPSDLYNNRMDNFKKYIIIKPLEEINKKTVFELRYEVIRSGKFISGFKIYMKYKEGADIQEEDSSALPAPPIEEKPYPALVLPAATSSDKEALIAAMLAEGMPKSGIHTWLKSYGVEGASASWQLAVEHADNRTETQGKGPQRKKYLKACMERNIAAINNDEARLKAEIDAREKRAAEEKKQAMQAMQEGFEKIGFTSRREGSGLQSMGSLLGVQEKPPETAEPQELTENQLRTITELWRENGNHFTDSLLQTLKDYGYTENTIMRRYWRYFIEAPESHAKAGL